MAGLKAAFRASQLFELFDQFKESADAKSLQTLQYIGEGFVNKARIQGNYRDRTGNLRASIGYVILKDGVPVAENFGGAGIGSSRAQQVAADVADLYPTGFVLIGVAGMQYARYVEAKNYDVITGAAPSLSDLKTIWHEIEF